MALILPQTIKTQPKHKMYKYYKDLGYTWEKGETIDVSVEHLLEKSEAVVAVQCDGGCKEIKHITYCSYINSLKNIFGKYYCKPCYGKARTSEVFSEYYLKTIGVYSPMILKETQDKKDKTTEDRFGVKNVMFLKETVAKREVSRINTLIERYKVDNVSSIPGIQQKKEENSLKIHGVKNILATDLVRAKIKKTNLERRGVEHVMQDPEVVKAVRKTMEENGTMTPLYLKGEWVLYKLICTRLTRRVRREVFKKWNGLDAYDNEDIRENFRLKWHNAMYPTMDHMISVFEGFKTGKTPEEICDITNICVTKRYINSSKKEKSDIEFKMLLKAKH